MENPNVVGAGVALEHKTVVGGCCTGAGPEVRTYTLSVKNSAGQERCLVENEGQLLWAADDRATVISLALSDKGTLTLELPNGLGVHMVDGTVRLSSRAKTPFLLDQIADLESRVYLRTEEGKYLGVSEPGAPLALTPVAGRNAEFLLERKNQFGEKWAADPGFRDDETRSTHLWIYNRARDAVKGRSSLGSGFLFGPTYSEDSRVALRWILDNGIFDSGVRQGIYDADNSGELNVYTSGFYYSAHFYNPSTGRGGSWDPLGNDKNTAVAFGTYYLKQALSEQDAYKCGRNLGLAIHYLEDLTQPMHCVDFRNDLSDWRHENYETWALHQQGEWTIQPKDLDELDMLVLAMDSAIFYWVDAAQRGRDQYREWQKSSRSPIGSDTPTERYAAPPPFANEWIPAASLMVKTAQRLVINLLLTWCSEAAFAAQHRGLPAADDKILICPPKPIERLVRVSRGPGERSDLAYQWISLVAGSREAWALEPVLEAGKQVFEGPDPVYFLRNRALKTCMVAGDPPDGNVYLLQDPGLRKNGQWIVQPTNHQVGRRDKSYPTYKICDRAHRKFLAVNTFPNPGGPLQHSDTGAEWILLPPSEY